MKLPPHPNFDEVLEYLGISDYKDRIWTSSSTGELMHLQDYWSLARAFQDNPESFRPIFQIAVRFAEKEWKRPESVFQHMPAIIQDIVRVNQQWKEVEKQSS